MDFYEDFARNISFFEFLQDEFYPPHFDTKGYAKEIVELQGLRMSIESLSEKLRDHPGIYDIVEELFQMSRFSNIQISHFLFDIPLINYASDNKIKEYGENQLLKFENGTPNKEFNKYFGKLKLSCFSAKLKIAMSKYLDRLVKKRDLLHSHIQNSIGTRYRISQYFINSLKLENYFEGIILNKYLSNKRKPYDSKSFTGNYGNIRIKRIFEEKGFVNGNAHVSDRKIDVNKIKFPFENIYYLEEVYIDGIKKRKGGTLKKFDYVLVKEGKVFAAIETNYYSTSGTKIAINVEEYTNLNEDIKSFDNSIKFMWITDGAYWLTTGGKKRLIDLKNKFFLDDWSIMNYNLLEKRILSFFDI